MDIRFPILWPLVKSFYRIQAHDEVMVALVSEDQPSPGVYVALREAFTWRRMEREQVSSRFL